ncbi:hypothetical protein TraAM80_08390 [Trypanosoma rangeli]|uniref:Non-canonical E2 ubiquitin-conjugating enzyme C-terminal domain-containing protein n=1 Tax=Trypanosoma rangeli TaxID=5698 RepID=A0A3R7KQ87_TRYRA|nr:uncharacterized protein TraAM80_08390 [Trypanosoma rangeli]RNE99250.1 hypothetical protein TraAM80_08390 [Trypanosoma rangeli]|eukprot:RNE99250.1 hypothetical protein TraAM80_08390 [Trypanosoma rangeli]
MKYADVLLRLSDAEREDLQLIIAALKVSEYTDDVDDIRRPHSREERMYRAMRDLFDTALGLCIASGSVSRELRAEVAKGNTDVRQTLSVLIGLFEIFRRHKRLNPFSNRSEFGKLVMLLQDVQKRSVQDRLRISHSLLVPVQTVGMELRKAGAETLLEDGDVEKYVWAHGAEKAALFQRILDRHGAGACRPVVERCLRSIDDVEHFLENNLRPLRWLRRVLNEEFLPQEGDKAHDLSIRAGFRGARFSHDHRRHCQYVAESLTMWENVQRHIFDFWQVSEDDMLLDGGGHYSFVNTGQGYHRMCRAPKSYARMARCVAETEQEMGGWVGIKVIHLGDRDVPNPLVFIDKYTVIPRIVQPIMHTILELEKIFAPGSLEEYPGLRNLLRAKFHSYAALRTMILSDFFRHAFDGSGDDGGSCIDGRLTSAWNWCHQLEKKPYYDAFVLTGFSGFD